MKSAPLAMYYQVNDISVDSPASSLEGYTFAGTAENTVTLDQSSVLAFSDTSTLQILGTNEDSVVMSDAASWTNLGSVSLNGNTFTQYQNGNAILQVQEGVNN